MLNAENILRWAGDICFAGATLGCFYLAFAAILIHRFRCKERRHIYAAPPVTVLVPLCGSEPDLHRRLLILCRQNYPAPVQIVCGTLDGNDPALDIVRAVKAADRLHSIEYHVDTRVHGLNLKISNLINMAAHARHDTLVLVDSDVEVDTDHLSKMVAELQRSNVGAVNCLYRGIAVGGIWARLAALRINAEFLPDVIVGLSTALAQPCFGASIAISRETLKRIGGFPAFADQLWDDYAIGQAVRELGYEVAIAPFTVDHIYTENTAREWFSDEFRAVRTIRGIDPLGHAGSVITHPLPLALIAALLTGGRETIALAFIALACRIMAWRSAEYRFRTRSGTMILLLPARELLSFLVYVASFFGTTVTWRGQRYRLTDQTVAADWVNR